ncbi:MAG: hypothetical protein LLG14_21700 [Nocardiaceae bacterium]|nr:hypothetical protein [Nocardiaceae bacterium]
MVKDQIMRRLSVPLAAAALGGAMLITPPTANALNFGLVFTAGGNIGGGGIFYPPGRHFNFVFSNHNVGGFHFHFGP